MAPALTLLEAWVTPARSRAGSRRDSPRGGRGHASAPRSAPSCAGAGSSTGATCCRPAAGSRRAGPSAPWAAPAERRRLRGPARADHERGGLVPVRAPMLGSTAGSGLPEKPTRPGLMWKRRLRSRPARTTGDPLSGTKPAPLPVFVADVLASPRTGPARRGFTARPVALPPTRAWPVAARQDRNDAYDDPSPHSNCQRGAVVK